LAGSLDFEGDDEKRAADEVNATLRDHVTFNPARAEVRRIRGEWKIVDGNHCIFGFDRSCQVVPSKPQFVYYRK